MSMTTDPTSSKRSVEHIARSKRTISLRHMTGLSRGAFEKETGIPRSSQQNWESPSANGLTEDGARRMLQACDMLGVHASFEWLMFGFGNSPFIETARDNEITPRQPPVIQENQLQTMIQEELTVFSSHYKYSIHMAISDNSMEPLFIQNDWVAGNRYFKGDVALAVGYDCIVVTHDGKVLLRHLKKSDLQDHYALICRNSLAEARNVYDIKLVSAAPVLWIRHPDPIVSS